MLPAHPLAWAAAPASSSSGTGLAGASAATTSVSVAATAAPVRCRHLPCVYLLDRTRASFPPGLLHRRGLRRSTEHDRRATGMGVSQPTCPRPHRLRTGCFGGTNLGRVATAVHRRRASGSGGREVHLARVSCGGKSPVTLVSGSAEERHEDVAGTSNTEIASRTGYVSADPIIEWKACTTVERSRDDRGRPPPSWPGGLDRHPLSQGRPHPPLRCRGRSAHRWR
jgi:hypothetical protein